jgi:heme/copper-type cytochrome/quinol oxidase subunit 2
MNTSALIIMIATTGTVTVLMVYFMVKIIKGDRKKE